MPTKNNSTKRYFVQSSLVNLAPYKIFLYKNPMVLNIAIITLLHDLILSIFCI